jgi:hypothetical protein
LEELRWHVFRFAWLQLTGDNVEFLLNLASALDLEPMKWKPKRRISRNASATKFASWQR